MEGLQRRLCAALRVRLAGGTARLPEGSAIIWNAFSALSRARSCGANGPNPIAYSEIAVWCQLTRTPLEPHHVEIITAMDAVWMERTYQREGQDGQKVLPRGSGQTLTPDMFDLAMG
ncbi:hypothetical protein [Palleronia sp. LCG004]|uniref:phage tail assembly chaperone n=1 Tax=Palleronia sp. LCG004 TaxID=3079304 RepID=UPI002943C54F|nr:hypothetical protein [Palleronia sp. LCG004]WOI55122.1 hypothetical protein RVY76_08615 [Palleronia sp. LCG004]